MYESYGGAPAQRLPADQDAWPTDVPDEVHIEQIMADFGLSEPDAWVLLSTSRGGDGDVVGLRAGKERSIG